MQSVGPCSPVLAPRVIPKFGPSGEHVGPTQELELVYIATFAIQPPPSQIPLQQSPSPLGQGPPSSAQAAVPEGAQAAVPGPNGPGAQFPEQQSGPCVQTLPSTKHEA